MTARWARLLLLVVMIAGWGCGTQPADENPGQPPARTPPDPDLTGPDLFQEVASPKGIDFTYRNGEEAGHLAILESLGGGVGLIDYNGDGLLDLFVTGGGYYDGPDKKQIKGHPCKLFKNLGGFQFKDVTEAAGLDKLAGGEPWFYTHGAAVADYDRDGWPDLLATGWGRIALFRNVPAEEGDPSKGRRFLDVSERAGLKRGITWATSAAFADLDGDGWPDLYVCQYVNWSFANHPTNCNYDGATRDVCPPKRFHGLPDKLFRNNGDRTFTDISDRAGLNKADEHASKALGVIAVDVNADGKPELYVANDTEANFFYVNHSTPSPLPLSPGGRGEGVRGEIRLKEEGLLAGLALDGGGGTNGSMGLAAGDPEGIGKPALWVTNYENELHALYRNLSEKDRVHFLFCTPAAGIAAIGQKFVGWGTGFLDVDLDGWEDLFVANGHAIRYPKTAERRQKPVLLRNRGSGKFKDISPRGGEYFRRQHLGRGVAPGDLDNDGRVDLVISHVNDPVSILRNIAPAEGRHWLGVELAGKGHADVVGARVVLAAGGRKQSRFAVGGGSYASAPDRRFVFGLGTTGRIDKLTVVWPDGSRQEWTGLAPDRYYRLTRGEQKAEPRSPAQ